MATVVLVRPAVPGVAAVAALAEVRREVRVVIGRVAHVVVPGEDAVRQPRLVETLVLCVGVLPLVLGVVVAGGPVGGDVVVGDVAGVHDVLQVEAVALLQQEVVDVDLVLVEGVVTGGTGQVAWFSL
jgi:hypothetical protein